jgi:hypothetical protein
MSQSAAVHPVVFSAARVPARRPFRRRTCTAPCIGGCGGGSRVFSCAWEPTTSPRKRARLPAIGHEHTTLIPWPSLLAECTGFITSSNRRRGVIALDMRQEEQ